MTVPTIERYQQAFAYLSQSLGAEVAFDPTADPMLFAEALASDQQGFTDYLALVMPKEVVDLLALLDGGPDDREDMTPEEQLDEAIKRVLELYPDNPWAEEPEEARLDS